MTSLDALKAVTTVVADTGDFESECSLVSSAPFRHLQGWMARRGSLRARRGCP